LVALQQKTPGEDAFIILTKNNTIIMEKRNITMQIKEMANFIMYVLVEFVFSDSYMYFDLNLNAIIIKLHALMHCRFDMYTCIKEEGTLFTKYRPTRGMNIHIYNYLKHNIYV
jgi:hypothetical protein